MISACTGSTVVVARPALLISVYRELANCALTYFLQTPHFPPSFAQCLQYLQFLQA